MTAEQPSTAPRQLRIVEPDSVQPAPAQPRRRESIAAIVEAAQRRAISDAAAVAPIEYDPPLRIVEPDAIEQDAAPPRTPELSDAEREQLAEDIASRRAANTQRAYAKQWRGFERYCAAHDADAMPAAPLTVAAYLSGRAAAGMSYSTISQARAAIAVQHREANAPDPTADERVRATIAGIRRKSRPAARAEGLTRIEIRRIRATAQQARELPQRRTKQGAPVYESDAAAERRAAVDIALLAVMRDGFLRRSEAAALRWRDIAEGENGKGRARIAKRKNRQDPNAPYYAGLRPQTMQALAAIRPADAPPDAPVFTGRKGEPLSARRISERIAAAARAAGIDGRVSGHSLRIGSAIDFTQAGAPLQATMDAGDWKSADLVRSYTAETDADNSPIHRWLPAED